MGLHSQISRESCGEETVYVIESLEDENTDIDLADVERVLREQDFEEVGSGGMDMSLWYSGLDITFNYNPEKDRATLNTGVELSPTKEGFLDEALSTTYGYSIPELVGYQKDPDKEVYTIGQDI